jgi:hypothetical protein
MVSLWRESLKVLNLFCDAVVEKSVVLYHAAVKTGEMRKGIVLGNRSGDNIVHTDI